MNYWLEGNELVIKKLFKEKRYSFLELTKLNLDYGMSIYLDDKCILWEKKDYNKLAVFQTDILELAEKNNLIIEYQDVFEDEISVIDIPDFSMQVQEEVQKEVCDYVKQELGEEYELVISEDKMPYSVILVIDIYRNGEKVCINDEEERNFYTNWRKGKKDIHLSWFGIVAPRYVNPKTREYKITKKIDIRDDIEEIKEQIDTMKKCGAVPVSQFV